MSTATPAHPARHPPAPITSLIGRGWAPPGHLPTPLTSLIGRERELAAVAMLLRDDNTRLVVLTGPGGVGKTRLALQIAADLADGFADGGWYVALAPINDPHLVGPAIAQALGVRESGDRPLLEGIKGYLRERDALLLLDNFEQVVAAGPLVVDLLTACPTLKILVTSRSVLRVSGEHDFQVPPLTLPLTRRTQTVEEVIAAEAVRLFLARARAAKPDFALSEANAAAVAAICRRLDGLPLAIELAAARIAHLPPQALLARLERRLPLLTGGARDQPARLRTMRNAIAWSYDLLDAAEQRLFRRLSAFAGGCTLEAVEAVCQSTGDLGIDVLDGLGSLVDLSLLSQEEQPGAEPRFAMLETIREYGLEQLAASSEEGTVRTAHAAYFLALAEQAEPALKGPDQVRWWARLEADQANLRAVLTWMIERTESEGSLRFTAALAWYWWTRGHPGEGRDWLERALALSAGAPPAVRAKALCGICPLAGEQGDYERAFACAEEALALSRKIGDEAGVALALRMLAVAAHDKGDYGRAIPLYEESLAHYRAVRDRWGISNVLGNLGRLACFEGDFEHATTLLMECLTLDRQAGDTYGMAGALWALAEVARRRGDHDVATAHYGESLSLRWQRGDKRLLPEVLRGLARTEAATGDPARAARLAGAEEALREAIAIPLNPPPERARYEADIAKVLSAMDEQAFAAAWAAGRALPLDQAIAEALALPPANTAVGPETRDRRTDAIPLTPREVDVLRLVVDGKTDQEIADALFISRRTVSTHVSSILNKLGAVSRAAAVAAAIRRGLV